MKKKSIVFLLLISFVTLILAGCGGEKKASAPEKKNEPVVLAYTPFTGYGALFVAKEKGFFKNKGVDVELQAIEGIGDRKQALVAGKLQGMTATIDVAVSAVGEGVPLKAVWAFDASNGADGIIVKSGKGIEKIADLKGREVAFHRGSASHFLLTTLLEKAGLTDNDIKAVDMKASEAASAFMAGKVDAAVTWEPYLTKAVAGGDVLLGSTKETPGLIADVLTLREDFVKQNPDKAQAIVAALAEATDYMSKNPEETSKILAAAFKMKPEDVNADIKTLKFYDLKENQAFFGTKEKPGPAYEVGKRAGEFYVKLKVLQKTPDLTAFIDSSFIEKTK